MTTQMMMATTINPTLSFGVSKLKCEIVIYDNGIWTWKNEGEAVELFGQDKVSDWLIYFWGVARRYGYDHRTGFKGVSKEALSAFAASLDNRLFEREEF